MAHIDTNILENYTTSCNIKTAYCQIQSGNQLRIGCYAYWNGSLIPNCWIILRIWNALKTAYVDRNIGQTGSDGWYGGYYTLVEEDILAADQNGWLQLHSHSDPKGWGSSYQIRFTAVPTSQMNFTTTLTLNPTTVNPDGTFEAYGNVKNYGTAADIVRIKVTIGGTVKCDKDGPTINAGATQEARCTEMMAPSTPGTYTVVMKVWGKSYQTETDADARSATLTVVPSTCNQYFKVVDENGVIIVDAKVCIGTYPCGYTDAWGRVGFPLVQGTTYTATASKTGYTCLSCTETFTACIDSFDSPTVLSLEEAPPKYKCTGSPLYQCIEDPSGAYETPAACQAACVAPTTPYAEIITYTPPTELKEGSVIEVPVAIKNTGTKDMPLLGGCRVYLFDGTTEIDHEPDTSWKSLAVNGTWDVTVDSKYPKTWRMPNKDVTLTLKTKDKDLGWQDEESFIVKYKAPPKPGELQIKSCEPTEFPSGMYGIGFQHMVINVTVLNLLSDTANVKLRLTAEKGTRIVDEEPDIYWKDVSSGGEWTEKVGVPSEENPEAYFGDETLRVELWEKDTTNFTDSVDIKVGKGEVPSFLDKIIKWLALTLGISESSAALILYGGISLFALVIILSIVK